MSRMRVLSVGFVAIGALIAAACTPTGGGAGGSTGTPPVAVIGVDHSSGVAPLTVVFTSANSTDADGTITSRAWNFGDISSPSNSASTTIATHTFAAAGTYVVTLLVTDNSGKFNSAQTNIVVSAAPVNQPPVAVASPSTLAGKAPLAVTFTGDTSSDPDGTVSAFLWTFDDAASGVLNTATTANAAHTFSAAGTYIVSLKVTDNLGATNTVTTAPIVVAPNQAPSASATGAPLSGKEPLTVAFSSAGTSDPDDATPTLTYSWNFGDGTSASTSPDPTHTYSTAVGSPFTATLTVTDPLGASDQKTVVVGVNANQAPTAVANVAVGSSTAGIVPLVVDFVGSDSTDDGTIVSYLWTFSPGITSTLADPQFTFGTTGNYPVTLTVTDDNNVTDTATININVNPVPNVPPIAVASVTPASGKQGTIFQFTGDQSSDPDNTPGPPITYLWDFGDGGTSTLANPSHAFSATGNRTVQLQVKDAANGTNTATVQVQVDLDQPPTAVANGAPLTGKAPLLVTFSSVGTADADDALGTLTYLWTFTGGATSTLANPTYNFTTAGAKTATLRVTDPFGKFDENTVSITVNNNQNPVAVANGSPGSGLEDLTVNFSSVGTADPDDALGTLTYAWNFGDPTSGGANVSTSANPSHTYATPGTYTATLTVTDPYSGTNNATAGVTVYQDTDGDLYSPNAAAGTGIDCNDTSAAINPGATDTVGDGTDPNCDGIDGTVANAVFVNSNGGVDSGSCGAMGSPCASIGQAETNAPGQSKTEVYVAGGTYAKFTVASGLKIRGGFGQNWQRGAAGTNPKIATVNASSDLGIGGPVAIIASGITAATSVADLTVQGVTAAAGQASYGIHITNSTSALTLNGLTIIGGTGGAGSAGTNGASTAGAATAGSPGQNSEEDGAVCSTDRKSGGAGAGSSTRGGGAGGQGGSQDTSCSFFGYNYNATGGLSGSLGGGGASGGGGGSGAGSGDASPGGTGTAGAVTDGSGGAAGAASNGSLSGGSWIPSGGTGGTGTLGADGKGGGGGGGGGGSDETNDDFGAGGGGGGQGGLAAASSGAGGTAGRASIALALINSSPTLSAVQITLGTGGAGGTGGSGGTGQTGGAGGAGGRGLCNNNTGYSGYPFGICTTGGNGGAGGTGGAGGRGGHAGGGGGGAGGPALGIVKTASSSPVGTPLFSGGAGGAGGTGGTTGVTGTAGQTGLVTNTVTL